MTWTEEERKGSVWDFISNVWYSATHTPELEAGLIAFLLRIDDELFDEITSRRIAIVDGSSQASTTFPYIIVCPPCKEITTRRIDIVFFSNHLQGMPSEVIIGVIAHEFAHMVLGHVGTSREASFEAEQQADDLARSWGFVEEIKAMEQIFPAQ